MLHRSYAAKVLKRKRRYSISNLHTTFLGSYFLTISQKSKVLNKKGEEHLFMMVPQWYKTILWRFRSILHNTFSVQSLCRILIRFQAIEWNIIKIALPRNFFSSTNWRLIKESSEKEKIGMLQILWSKNAIKCQTIYIVAHFRVTEFLK